MTGLRPALRAKRLAYLRWLSDRALGPQQTNRIPPGFLSRALEKRENRLFAALGGALCFQLLRTAHHVGLFKLLHAKPGRSRDEIQEALGLSAHSTEILLLGLVPMKLVERICGRYYNDP